MFIKVSETVKLYLSVLRFLIIVFGHTIDSFHILYNAIYVSQLLTILWKQTFSTSSILPGSLSDSYHDLLGMINECNLKLLTKDF